jgi:hypothetical protein
LDFRSLEMTGKDFVSNELVIKLINDLKNKGLLGKV